MLVVMQMAKIFHLHRTLFSYVQEKEQALDVLVPTIAYVKAFFCAIGYIQNLSGVLCKTDPDPD